MKTELAIIGSGPAGLAAAIEASKYGVEVIIIDENYKAGGQLFKQIHKFFGSTEHKAGIRGIDIGKELLTETEKLGAKILLNTVAWGIFKDKKVGISTSGSSNFIDFKRVIVATGAYENTITFPGWTLPGVVGAGAAQTMMNIYRVKPGNKVLMVGSGNVDVIAIIELQKNIGGYYVHAAKIMRAGVPIYTSSTILSAEGKDSVEEITIAKVDEHGTPINKYKKIFNVDTVCLAVGLRPRTRLIELINPKMNFVPVLGGFVPVHDDNMETSKKDFYIAGDLAGVEEASIAIEEGKLSGFAVANSLGYIKNEIYIREKENILNRLYELRKGPFGELANKAKQELIRSFYE